MTLSRSRLAASLAAALSAAALCATGLLAAAASASPRPSVTVIARGLDAPKYLAIGPGGLYVAESGRGGPHCVIGVANITVTHVCAGDSGAVVRITGHGSQVVERHLASASVASTHGVSGVTAVAFTRRRLVVLFDDGGVGPTGVSGIAPPFGAAFGKLDLASWPGGGPLHARADLAAFAATHPQSPAALGGLPGETLYDSDPHDMVAYRGGFAVADAAANDLVWVSPRGRISVLARFTTQLETAPAGTLGPGSPAMPIRAQAVPSSVTVGPGGALYVGLLIGIPSLAGTAAVERVVPGHPPTVVVDGLTRVSDLAFDPRGRLDILEANIAGGPMPGTGGLLRATLRRGQPVHAHDLDVPGLQAPVGLAVDPRTGVAYVTDDTTVPGGAEVVAIHDLGDAPGYSR